VKPPRARAGRAGLLGVIEEARDTEWCKREVLDEDVRAGPSGLLGGGLSGEQW
jgi:hypothetical protein